MGSHPSQRWGVSASTPRAFTLHIKNGWAPLPFVSSPWYVNSTGAFTTTNPARDYTIVVLTSGNADETTGVTTIEDVAGPSTAHSPVLARCSARRIPSLTRPGTSRTNRSHPFRAGSSATWPARPAQTRASCARQGLLRSVKKSSMRESLARTSFTANPWTYGRIILAAWATTLAGA